MGDNVVIPIEFDKRDNRNIKRNVLYTWAEVKKSNSLTRTLCFQSC